MMSRVFKDLPYKRKKARIILDDGREFGGRVFASGGIRYAEIIFNTGMVGYQEILTDPSYTGQAVVMTYPLLGNYGINKEDNESRKIFLEAIICKEYIDRPSNWRANKTLKEYLEERNILGIDQVDTRALTKHIRNKGASKAAITVFDDPLDTYVANLKKTNVIERFNVVKYASCDQTFLWTLPSNPEFKVAVIDCGIKLNILRYLRDVNCALTVYNCETHFEEILDKGYDGVFISNGPGDPEPLYNVSELVKNLLGKLPIFGICLGHQILGQALGISNYKLKFGHHGINHPIKNLRTGKIEITSQNHNYALRKEGIGDDVEITHVNLNDSTVAGIKHKEYPAFSVQYHPESAPGPRDSQYLFKNFCSMMKEFKRRKQTQRKSRQVSTVNLFVRQSFTESGEYESSITQGVLDVVESLNKKSLNINLLTGNKAFSANNFKKEFEVKYSKIFSSKNFRDTRLALMRQADGIIVIRTALSESTAFEISYNIFGGSRVPIFFAVSDKSPIKTTLLKDLDDYIEVKYHTFTDPNELLIPLGDFINNLATKKEDNEMISNLKNRNFFPTNTYHEGIRHSMFQ